MTRPAIALIDATHNHESTDRNFRREIPDSVSVTRFDATAPDLPLLNEYDGLIISGSRASVYWDEEWISETIDLLEQAAEKEVPMFGVCWGHQAIAHALGGTVESMEEYEIGYKTITQTTDDSTALDDIPNEFTSYITHSDEVTEIPAEATVTAKTDRSIQAFELGTVWGVQFHPEYDKSTALFVTEKKTEIDSDRKQRALESINDENYQNARIATRVFENFIEEVRNQTKINTTTDTEQTHRHTN